MSEGERIQELEREVAELRKFRRYVESAFDTLMVLEESGRVLYVSPASAMHGSRQPELIDGGQNMLDIVHPDQLEEARALLRRVAAGAPGESAFMRVRHQGLNGSWLEAEIVLRNFTHDPDVRGLLVTSRVAGTRNPLWVALQDSERRFRALFEATSIAVTLRDLDTQRFIDCNAAALRLYDVASREVLSATTPDNLAPPVQPDGTPSAAYLKNAVAVARRDGSFRGEWMARRLTGELFPAFLRISRIDLEDGPILQTFIEDITDAKRNEALLARAKEDAERANRMKSTFLAAMTHELRTPLTGVVGMVDLLTSTPHLDERQRRYAETARSSARMLMSVIDDILDFSKIEAGKLDLASAPFSVRDVIDEVGNVLALAAEQKGIDLVCSADGVDGKFLGDGDRLRQVVTNLVNNAIKFTAHGEVFVRAYAMEDDGHAITLRIDVADTGVGIAQGDIQRVFAPFTQLEPRERGQPGSGLGLTICRELVERMGGTIGAESTHGVGSTFFFTLRLLRAETAHAAEPPLRGRVLVVSSSARAREVLVHHLTRLGCGVDTASDAATMHQRLLTLPDEKTVVVVDDPRSGVDGRVLVAQIRDDARFDGARIVFVESIAHPLDDDEREHLGVAASSTKPVWSGKLESALREVTKDTRSRTSSAPRSSSSRRAARVLLVDDDAINSDVARGLLSGAGYDDVVIARDGVEAIDVFTRESCDVVLMDCRLPRIDGLEATRRMRAIERQTGRSRTPIVALTASGTTEELAACMAAGMDEHLAKPVDGRRLIETIERHLARATPPCNLAHGLERLRGDKALLDKLIHQFIDVAPAARSALEDAITRRDRGAAQYAAHRFRGQAATFDAHALVAALGSLEDHARVDDWDAARRAYDTAVRELARVREDLTRAVARGAG